jgi:hypothetical protein
MSIGDWIWIAAGVLVTLLVEGGVVYWALRELRTANNE